ncbi:uncharacterized protein [Leptinotarsa decemlineata]|uniref:uncharacterized protein n=1 Tax=Leptinotarsa decemlineata TaxID=7539 RepID=UPI003D30A4B6
MMAVCNKSDYLLTLERENKDIAVHYKDKIRVIQCMDSFTFTSEEMNSSIECFPPVTAFDMSSYLVLTHSFYTNQQMKAYKSLTGYKYFEAGFVHDCEAKSMGEHIVVIATVKHSQRMNNLPVQVWIIFEKYGAIISAHCTCMADHSEVHHIPILPSIFLFLVN